MSWLPYQKALPLFSPMIWNTLFTVHDGSVVEKCHLVTELVLKCWKQVCIKNVQKSSLDLNIWHIQFEYNTGSSLWLLCIFGPEFQWFAQSPDISHHFYTLLISATKKSSFQLFPLIGRVVFILSMCLLVKYSTDG